MNVLVAGATGYLRHYVMQEFKRRGHWIRALAGQLGHRRMRLFDPCAAELFDFFATAGQYENVAPRYGTHTLDDYYCLLSHPAADDRGLGFSIA
jgi:hypothetical protein